MFRKEIKAFDERFPAAANSNAIPKFYKMTKEQADNLYSNLTYVIIKREMKFTQLALDADVPYVVLRRIFAGRNQLVSKNLVDRVTRVLGFCVSDLIKPKRPVVRKS